jgi:hypothetical protein
MAPVHTLQDRVQKIDQQMIDLAAERTTLCQQLIEEHEEVAEEIAAETVGLWSDAADEHGWPMGVTAKIARGFIDLCRVQGE